jgi:hypothetical protein
MERANLLDGSSHRHLSGKSYSPNKPHQIAARAAGEKSGNTAAHRKTPSRSPRKETGGKSKSGKLVCRYCGSDDLSPSFVKRRDRRCRRCFSKRYGSAARASKAKVKK